jgi:ABC-type Fe3+/spermidine/putrescine transport system ATPase subunit
MKAYAGGKGRPAVIVKDFILKIAKGEFVTVIGHSGCGKSTQLMMLAGLTDITEGAIIIAGKEIAGPRPDRGIRFPIAVAPAMAHGI